MTGPSYHLIISLVAGEGKSVHVFSSDMAMFRAWYRGRSSTVWHALHVPWPARYEQLPISSSLLILGNYREKIVF